MIMSKITLPQIVNAGIYDAATVHKTCSVTPERRVSVFELELPFGKGGTSFINKKSYKISGSHILCGKPGQLRHTVLPYRCRFIHLLTEDDYLKNLIFSFPDRIDICNDIKKFTQIFNDIICVYITPSQNCELYLGSKVLQLLYMLSHKVSHSESLYANVNNIVAQGMAYMDKHFTEKIKLDDIASAVSVSPIYFHQTFTRTMGQTTPLDYILNKRIDLAKKLLITSTLTLAEITYRVGFSSQSYFGRVFKRKTNTTPYEYRKFYFSKYPED